MENDYSFVTYSRHLGTTAETMNDDESDESDRTMTIRAPSRAIARSEIGHFLTFTDGEGTRRVAIGPGGLLIGRLPPCDLAIPASDISRRHCRIDLDGDCAVVTDLGSTNGTFVEGSRIEAPTRLDHGCALAFGTFPLRYDRRDAREVAEEAQLAADLRRAADYVRAILPDRISDGPVRADWWFEPCAQLGGDAFGYQFLDADSFAGFLLDVSGHGIGSAMHAVNVANVLRRHALPGVDFRQPAQVAQALNAMFPMEQHNDLMLTLCYFVFQPSTRTLTFCSAGHHASHLVAPDAGEPEALWQRGPAIGMLPMGRWQTGSVAVPPGARLYVCSDGAFEIVEPGGRAWELDDLRRLIAAQGMADARAVWQGVRAAARPGPLDDDVSLLVISFP